MRILTVIIIALLGTFLGALANVYGYFDQKSKPIVRWYIGLLCKNALLIFTNILMPILLILTFLKYGFNIDFIGYSILIIILIMASIEDIRFKKISNKLVIIGLTLGLVIAPFHGSIDYVINSILGAVIPFGILILVSFLSKGGIGMGDIKLAAMIGIFVGVDNIMSVLFLAFILSAITSIILLAAKKADKKATIPFAPFLLGGSVLMLFL